MNLVADQLQADALEGCATPEGTAAYFADIGRSSGRSYQPDLWRTLAADTGLAVSRIGYGTYRVGAGDSEHYDALREALISGVNVIDCAANYGDGDAENVVGRVIDELRRANRVQREQIIVCTKAGYIQGKNISIWRANMARYSEAVEFSPTLAHCIQPEFLEDQITLSLRRLGLARIDFFFLHNPEYFLKAALRDGATPAAAHLEYERRLRAALEHLEREAERGRISYYGISSNVFAASADAPVVTRLDRILEFAPARFKAIQFPANLLEADFRFSRSSSGGNLADLAARAGLWTVGNRPLNANWSNRGLVRLARLVEAPPDDGLSTVAEFNRMMARVHEMEAETLRVFAPRHFHFDERTPAPSALIEPYRDAYLHHETFRPALPAAMRALQRTINGLYSLAVSDPERYVIEGLTRLTNAALALWERYIDVGYHQRMAGLEQALEAADPALAAQPLALQALQFLLCRPVPATALVGMRRRAYVRQCIRVFEQPPPPPGAALRLVQAAEAALERLLPLSR